MFKRLKEKAIMRLHKIIEGLCCQKEKGPSYHSLPPTCPSLPRLCQREKNAFCLHRVFCLYVELQDQWNGPYFFFLKSHISAPGAQNSPIFFPSVIYPLYLHVIIDFGHIWGPFMAEIEKMCQKSAFGVVRDFG